MEAVRTHREGAVAVVTIDDAATRNALGPEVYDALRTAMEAAGGDQDVRAVVITGANGFFSSGGNVKGLKARNEADAATRRASVARLHAMIRAVRACPCPVIAAVEGGAAGAGASLALACDMIVAAEGAYLSVAYVRIGISPDGGATASLARMVPAQMLAEMAMTGDRIPVARLHALGVVNALTPPGEALAEAMARAERLAKGPPGTLATIKRLCASAREAGFDAQLDAEEESLVETLGGAEAREGIAAFFAKRPPNFG